MQNDIIYLDNVVSVSKDAQEATLFHTWSLIMNLMQKCVPEWTPYFVIIVIILKIKKNNLNPDREGKILYNPFSLLYFLNMLIKVFTSQIIPWR